MERDFTPPGTDQSDVGWIVHLIVCLWLASLLLKQSFGHFCRVREVRMEI